MKKKIEMPLLDFLLSEEKPIESKADVNQKYRQMGKYPTFILVSKNEDGKETGHWSCEEPDVESIKSSSEKRGRTVEVFTTEDYWKNYHLGRFQMR